MALWEVVLAGIWAILPAYVGNMAATLTGGGPPIDGGRTHGDGHRLLGDGKTWRGWAGGTVFAAIATALLALLAPWLTGWFPATNYGGGWIAVIVGAAMGFGALLGDVVESYIKRRRGKLRGEMWFGPDQLDFIVGALAVTALVAFVTASLGTWAWFVDTFTWPILLVILVLTPVLHVLVNVVAWKLKLKDVPW